MSGCTIHGSIAGRIDGTKDDIIATADGQRSIVIEYRHCGCITWRHA